MRQKGFTLIELLVALAVGGLILAGALGGIYQVMWGTSRTNSQVVALTDEHYAALRLKKDLVMAQLGEEDFLPYPDDTTVITLMPGGDTATLGWTDYTSFGDLEPEERKHTSGYELFGNGELQRTYDGTISIVGRNITYVSFTQNPDNVEDGGDRVINVVITATEGEMTPRSETLEFSVYLRGEGLQ